MTVIEPNKRNELLRLKEKQSRLEVRLERARQQVEELQQKCAQNARRMQSLQISQPHVLGAHSTKSHQMHLVWRIIEAGLKHPDSKNGLLNRELLQAVVSEFRELKPETFRSYLHRFRKEGLIDKRGAYWLLKDQKFE